jgi:hypothetical protein
MEGLGHSGPLAYRRMLEEGWKESDLNGPLTRLEYLGDYVFEFITYDREMAELFSSKALEVCKAISDRTTFDYIKDAGNYRWFLLMCNMDFFSQRLNWGTSIRGAWWDTSAPNATTFSTCGLWLDGEQITDPQFSTDQWRDFIAALLTFGVEGPNVL